MAIASFVDHRLCLHTPEGLASKQWVLYKEHMHAVLPGVYAGLITKVDPTTNTNTNTNTNTTNTTNTNTTTGTGLINYSVTN